MKTLKKKHIRLSFIEGSEKDREIEDLKKFYGLSTSVEVMRLAIHATWRDHILNKALYKRNGDWGRHTIREALESPELCGAANLNGYRIVGIKKKEVKEDERSV